MRARDRGGHLLRRRHVGAERERPPAARFDLVHHLVELVGGGDSVVGEVAVRSSDVETRDVGALGRQSQRRRPADAPPTRRAGHEGDFPCDACQRHEILQDRARYTTARTPQATSVLYWWSGETL
ncbi:MAG TPA: hypothetical protein VKH82_05335 [Candidatus Binatia bacterium]|nr:hypothetical protein [Candidatus Binatia bacterium]